MEQSENFHKDPLYKEVFNQLDCLDFSFNSCGIILARLYGKIVGHMLNIIALIFYKTLIFQ